jgi:hypothetical protein
MAVLESQAPPWRDALARGNWVTSRRGALRREVRVLGTEAGRVRVAELLTDREPAVASMFPVDLLCWPQRMPQRLAAKFLLIAGVRDCRPVSRLTDRQVVLLAGMLRGERS